jgi:hypothetical protein
LHLCAACAGAGACTHRWSNPQQWTLWPPV